MRVDGKTSPGTRGGRAGRCVPRGAGHLAPCRLLAATLALLVALGATAQAQECPATPGDAFAFLPVTLARGTCPATPLVRWTEAEVEFDCGFFDDPAHGIDCGQGASQECVRSCRDAAATWSGEMAGRFRFVPADAATPGAFCDLDGRTSIGGSDQICDGSRIPDNVLAITYRVNIAGGPQDGRLLDADIMLNRRFRFSPALFRATVGHELGHVLGLDHPDRCGRDFNVLMRSSFMFPDVNPCFATVPVVDDVNGGRAIYPLIGPAPTPTARCGDADGNGRLTVTDGVQILRAAAGLTSGCTLAICDADGNGRIAVEDAIDVLRAAAGFTFAGSCGN